jgi:hypothetical protein
MLGMNTISMAANHVVASSPGPSHVFNVGWAWGRGIQCGMGLETRLPCSITQLAIAAVHHYNVIHAQHLVLGATMHCDVIQSKRICHTIYCMLLRSYSLYYTLATTLYLFTD